MGLSVADIYGSRQTNKDNTGSQMNGSSQSASTSKESSAAAKGKPMLGTGYGTIAILTIIGALIAAKFGFEGGKKG
jgi:hypothetical protein